MEDKIRAEIVKLELELNKIQEGLRKLEDDKQKLLQELLRTDGALTSLRKLLS